MPCVSNQTFRYQTLRYTTLRVKVPVPILQYDQGPDLLSYVFAGVGHVANKLSFNGDRFCLIKIRHCLNIR